MVLSDTFFAAVGPVGNVTVLNKTGMVVLTASDMVSGISHNSIVLRIA